MTTTPPLGVKPRSTVMEETAGRDVEMVDAELGEGNAGLEEEEARNRPEEARELGIATAVIARETRPKPVEKWLEREIGGKIFKLGRSLEVELQDQIAKVNGIWMHLRGPLRTCPGSIPTSCAIIWRWTTW